MKLHIVDSNNIIDLNFGFWLTSRIRLKILSNIRQYNYDYWDNYLDTLKTLGTKHYDCQQILIFAANNLECEGETGDLTIKIDNNILVPTFDRLKLHTITKTINYGTLSIKSCPVILKTFEYFADNISDYVREYYHI